MKHLTFHLDFISPYAYLAFERLPQALEGLSYSVAYRPLLLGALLKHHGQLGPAEIPSKRSWTYRHALWLGHAHGIPIRMPASHPYNPLPHLRLALATTDDGDISRHVAERIFGDVWQSAGEAGDAARLAALAASLQLLRDPAGDEVKAQLRANVDEAVARGVFGVPAIEVDGRVFWGFDGLPMLRGFLQGDPWFDGPDWEGADQRPSLLRSNIR
ncbi:2-hydroxychromene-2-carboxylate isomerase [Variovorax sp. J22P168]|uniref:2-hydroxychromene-2-carboxylate isomerase n=1 Tax=Variovorax jilinensis TaxID=3053513 RepID=UPI002574C20A|nr:2-hydroxychromene-2-carboxylate isomerase [Variovorax sp. J22P168]MDM0012292.1 2-hydroxychromene-2-carboxylate isomerase [Variovorax sp. J22P168]